MENNQNKPENSQEPLPISSAENSNDAQTVSTVNEAEAAIIESADPEPVKAEETIDHQPEPTNTITEEKESSPEPTEEVFSSKSSMITAIIVLVVIIGAFWYISRGNNQNGNGNEGEDVRITVNSNEETGEVKIINEEEGGKIVSSDTGTTPKGAIETEKKQPAEGNIIIKAFYSNTQEDPSLEDCSRVYALQREVEKKYDSDVVNTIRGLLTPLTDEEKSQGWISNIPAGSALSYVKIDNGTAIANFNSALGQTGGSCAVANIRAQIEQTLKQFPYIQAVSICINGNCNQEEILQP